MSGLDFASPTYRRSKNASLPHGLRTLATDAKQFGQASAAPDLGLGDPLEETRLQGRHGEALVLPSRAGASNERGIS